MLKQGICAAAITLLASSAMADMTLNAEESSVYFTSVKNNAIAENHHFTGLSGSYSDAGVASVSIDLATVETAIPIRNERMRDILFNVAKMPTAEISADVPADTVKGLKDGEQASITLPLSISLHGKTATYDATLRVSKLDDTLVATTESPLLINAADFGLDTGIAELQAIAQLNAIATAVPVYATLVFND